MLLRVLMAIFARIEGASVCDGAKGGAAGQSTAIGGGGCGGVAVGGRAVPVVGNSEKRPAPFGDDCRWTVYPLPTSYQARRRTHGYAHAHAYPHTHMHKEYTHIHDTAYRGWWNR